MDGFQVHPGPRGQPGRGWGHWQPHTHRAVSVQGQMQEWDGCATPPPQAALGSNGQTPGGCAALLVGARTGGCPGMWGLCPPGYHPPHQGLAQSSKWAPGYTHLLLALQLGCRPGKEHQPGGNAASLQPSLALIKSFALTSEHPNQIKTNGTERFINWSCTTRVNYQTHCSQTMALEMPWLEQAGNAWLGCTGSCGSQDEASTPTPIPLCLPACSHPPTEPEALGHPCHKPTQLPGPPGPPGLPRLGTRPLQPPSNTAHGQQLWADERPGWEEVPQHLCEQRTEMETQGMAGSGGTCRGHHPTRPRVLLTSLLISEKTN